MKIVWVTCSIWAGLALGTENSSEKDFPALKIMVRNCAHCHTQKEHPGAAFLKQEGLSDKATLAKVLEVIEKGKMPEGHADFAKTPDGARLIRWLKAQLKAK